LGRPQVSNAKGVTHNTVAESQEEGIKMTDPKEQIARVEDGLRQIDALIEKRMAELQAEDAQHDAELVELDETREAIRERLDKLKNSDDPASAA
jgi:hypothetical protein